MNSQAVSLVEARNGSPTLRLEREGRSVFLNSGYDPQKEAVKWASQVEIKGNTMLVLFGLGLGYHLRALDERFQGKAQIFVIEPSSEVRSLARESSVAAALLRQAHIHLVADWPGFKQAYDQLNDRWKSLFLVKIPVYTQLYVKEYQEVVHLFGRELTSLLVDHYTVMTSSETWQTNLFKNLRFLGETAPVASIFGSLPGRPVIIVSAGPSLARNVHLLEQAKGKALIIAVGTVLRLLVNRGIEPDLVLSFDGNLGNFTHHFENVVCSAPLLFDPAVHHKIVENYPGPRALLSTHRANQWLEQRLDQPVGYLKMGPSIANLGLSLACELGADPIIFIGQDLAFTDRKTHCPGTHAGDTGYDIGREWFGEGTFSETDVSHWRTKERVLVEGIDGRPVSTDQKMLTFLHWFEENIPQLAKGRTVIDATEGGARIAGTKVLSLMETLERYCRQDISQEIREVQADLSAKPGYDLVGFVSYLRQCRNVLNRLSLQCKKAARMSSRLLDYHLKSRALDLDAVQSQLSKVDRLLKEAREFCQPVHYLVHPILGFVSQMTGDGEPEQIARQSYAMYSQLHKAFALTVPLLDETIRALESRFEPVVHRDSLQPWRAGL